MLPSHFQDIERSCRIDVEIIERSPGRQVMAGLRRAMHNQIERAFALEEIGKPFPISNVKLVMREPPSALEQPLKIPRRVTLRAEKVCPHIIVDADHTSGTAVEKRHELRPNQTARAGDEDFHGSLFPLSPVITFSWTWLK